MGNEEDWDNKDDAFDVSYYGYDYDYDYDYEIYGNNYENYEIYDGDYDEVYDDNYDEIYDDDMYDFDYDDDDYKYDMDDSSYYGGTDDYDYIIYDDNLYGRKLPAIVVSSDTTKKEEQD